jgi:hypothetical protein
LAGFLSPIFPEDPACGAVEGAFFTRSQAFDCCCPDACRLLGAQAEIFRICHALGANGTSHWDGIPFAGRITFFLFGDTLFEREGVGGGHRLDEASLVGEAMVDYGYGGCLNASHRPSTTRGLFGLH